MGIEIKITGDTLAELQSGFATCALAFGAATVVHGEPLAMFGATFAPLVGVGAEPLAVAQEPEVKRTRRTKEQMVADAAAESLVKANLAMESLVKANLDMLAGRAEEKQQTAVELGRGLTAVEATKLVRDIAVVVPADEPDPDDSLDDMIDEEPVKEIAYSDVSTLALQVKDKLGAEKASAFFKQALAPFGKTQFKQLDAKDYAAMHKSLADRFAA